MIDKSLYSIIILDTDYYLPDGDWFSEARHVVFSLDRDGKQAEIKCPQ